jgi:hypothetical protein
MQLARIQDLPFIKLFNCYKKSDNYAEKSDLVRYEILYQQGGVYVDHDVKCLKSFEPLCRTYDFFCGMEMPYQTFLSSSVLPTSNVLGCRQGHPILKNAMDWLDQLWDRIELQFPGKDRDAVINRVAHRTMLGLAEAFKMKSNEVGNRDIALPTFYFNAPEEKVAIFSYHLRKETWLESESEFEHLVKERLGKISKKTNRVLFVFGIFSVLNIIGLLLLIMKYGKKSRSTI